MKTDELLSDLLPADVALAASVVSAVQESERKELNGDIESLADVELSVTLEAFKQRAKRESKRYWDAVDSEFWFCVYFKTREQKEAFLNLSGWFEIGDKYLDGRQVAERLKIELPASPLPKRTRKARTDGIDVME